MTWIWIAAAVVALYGLHRLALWAERRGWIYYRDRSGSPGTTADAMLELHGMLEPGAREVLESRRSEDGEEERSGDPPEPGRGGPPRDPV